MCHSAQRNILKNHQQSLITLIVGLIFQFSVMFSFAATINSAGTGNWSSRSSWSQVAGTGTISYTAGSTAVTGTGTSFTTELTAGDIIITDKGSAISIAVASIIDDNHLTLVSTPSKSAGLRNFMVSRLPAATDDVHIIGGYTITVDISNAYCSSISIGNGGNKDCTLAFNANSQLSVSSSVTLNTTNNKTILLDMTNGGTLICASLAVPSTGGIQKFTAGSGTIILTAGNTIPAAVFTTFNNLTLQAGTTTTANNITINGTLTMAGTASLSASAYPIIFGTNGTLRYKGSSLQTATSNEFPAASSPKNLIIDNPSGVSFGLQRTLSGNMTVTSGSVCTITTSGQLTVSGTLTNNAGNSGIIIESTAAGTGSLIQNTINVPMTIQRFVSGFDYTSGTLSNKKYHCVSVPLVPANNSVSGLFMGSYLYDYNPATNAFVAWNYPTGTPMDETEGFMIFYPNALGKTYEFAGEANSGTFTCNTSPAGSGYYYLVPNPYPSAIDWNAASGWTKTNIDASISIWNSTSQNYAAWNGSVGTNGGSRYVQVGQSFFVQSTTASPTLAMNNSVRVHNTTPFLKEQESLNNALRLHVDANGASDELVIYFDDAGVYAHKIIGFNGPPKIYSYSGTQMLAIQALPHYSQPTSVEVGFQMTVDSLVTLTASEFESFDPFLSITLEDKLSGQLIDLRTNPVYTFAHSHSNFQNRFTVHFGNSTTSINESAHDFSIYTSNDQIAISIPALVGKEATVEILDLAGRLLWTREMTLENCSLIPQPDVHGIVLVRVTGSTGIFTDRLMIQK